MIATYLLLYCGLYTCIYASAFHIRVVVVVSAPVAKVFSACSYSHSFLQAITLVQNHFFQLISVNY